MSSNQQGMSNFHGEDSLRDSWRNSQEFSRHPLAIDLITGKTFDVPIKVDGDDFTIDLLLTDNPLVIKMFWKD